jgi:rfaE bifunctional protein kinase chain/domain
MWAIPEEKERNKNFFRPAKKKRILCLLTGPAKGCHSSFLYLWAAFYEVDSLIKLFENFNRLKVLIIGDAMLDAYVWGRVERISPEAPVPVVAVSKKEERPGGAANVALNIKALGAMPVLCTLTGKDEAGKKFISLMKKNGLPVNGISASIERVTTVKTRIIGNRHQLMRVDEESSHHLSKKEETSFTLLLRQLIRNVKPHVIIFEDYDKGLITPGIIQMVISLAAKTGIPVAVDPKKNNFHHYTGVTLFKPNLKELKEGLKLDVLSHENVINHPEVKKFISRQKIKNLMVTLSEHGIYYSSNGKSEIRPAHVRNISDVSGAGDTVISVAALCLAMNCHPSYIAALANLAGGLVCEKVGVVPVDKKQLIEEARREGLV